MQRLRGEPAKVVPVFLEELDVNIEAVGLNVVRSAPQSPYAAVRDGYRPNPGLAGPSPYARPYDGPRCTVIDKCVQRRVQPPRKPQ